MTTRRRKEPSELPSMFTEILTDESPAVLMAKDPQLASLAMLMARKIFESEYRRSDNNDSAPPRTAWCKALEKRMCTMTNYADVRSWEAGIGPVPAAALVEALAISDLDLDRVSLSQVNVIEWVQLLERVVYELRPDTIEKELLPRIMALPMAKNPSWKGLAVDLAAAAKEIKKAELLVRATMADAERLRFLALAYEQEPAE